MTVSRLTATSSEASATQVQAGVAEHLTRKSARMCRPA